MDEHTLRTLLQTSRTIAIVGMSDKPDRDSHTVGVYLISRGYRVIPVNPAVPEILGHTSYPSVKDIPPEEHVDIIDVFRKSDAVPGIVEEVFTLPNPPKAVWLQQGVRDKASGARVEGKGIAFVQDTCIRTEHQRLLGN